MSEQSWTPTPKVAAAGVGGAAATIIMVVLQNAFPEVDWPAGLEAAIATIVTAASAYIKRDA